MSTQPKVNGLVVDTVGGTVSSSNRFYSFEYVSDLEAAKKRARDEIEALKADVRLLELKNEALTEDLRLARVKLKGNK